MINWLKAKALSLLDNLDNLNDPFQEFTRPVIPYRHQETLACKAQWFEEDLSAFESNAKDILWYEIPLDDRLPMPVGDLAVWQGHAVAMSALKYHVTKVRTDFRDGWLDGMKNFFVEWPQGRRLVRWAGPPIVDDASNDTATGILVASAFTILFGPEDAKERARTLLYWLAEELRENEYALMGPNGKPTTYGVLIQGWRTDPLRLTLCLAIFRAAMFFLPTADFSRDFHQLFRTYRSLIPFAKVRLWWLNSYSDSHRAASHLAILHILYQTEETHEGLERLWRKERKTGNAWIGFLVMWALSRGDNSDVLNFKKLLHEFTFPLSNTKRDNTDNPLFKKVLWDGKYMAAQPIPVWMKASDEFRWCRNPYSLVSGTTPPSARHNGLGFLLPYWFGRALGHISVYE